MPVPWEALLPLGQGRQFACYDICLHRQTGIMTAFFGVTGTALNLTERVSNLGRVRGKIDLGTLFSDIGWPTERPLQPRPVGHHDGQP